MNERKIFTPQDINTKYIVEGIQRGSYIPPTEEEIRAFIEHEWATTVPLLQLPQNDAEFLQEVYIVEKLSAVKRKAFHALAGPVLVVDKDEHQNVSSDFGLAPNESYILTGSVVRQAEKKYGMNRMTSAAKIDFISEPPKGPTSIVIENDLGGRSIENLYTWGVRDFFYDEVDIDSYGVQRAEFVELIKKMSPETNPSKIVVVDMGFGNGKPLYQMQMYASEFLRQKTETIGLGFEEALCSYPVDRRIIGPMERMPKELFEIADILISNRSFEYFPFPDIALYGAVLAMKPGGWAKIEFGYEDSFLLTQPLFFPDFPYDYTGMPLYQRVQNAFDALNELNRQGLISLGAPLSSELPNLHYHYNIRLTKNGSIQPEFFHEYFQ